jgi:hypothetical protein
MSERPSNSRLAARAAANAVAVIAIAAIFGFKTHIDSGLRRQEAENLAARQTAVAAYDPYFTEQP